MLKIIRNTRFAKWCQCLRRSLPSTRYMLIVTETDQRLVGSLDAGREYIKANNLPHDTKLVPVWISDIEIIARSDASAVNA